MSAVSAVSAAAAAAAMAAQALFDHYVINKLYYMSNTYWKSENYTRARALVCAFVCVRVYRHNRVILFYGLRRCSVWRSACV